MIEPEIGAHVVAPRLGYQHHGIYVGGGRVIQYTGPIRAAFRGLIEEVPLEAFAKGQSIDMKAHVAPRFTGVEAVQRARQRLGERRYSLFRNNCEHFVEWTITGQSRSSQLLAWQIRLQKLWPFTARTRAARTALS